MARIRTIKPDTFTSESIAMLTLPARWTFVGLWTHVDDEGRCKDNPRIIRGALWPNDEETVSSGDVDDHLVELDNRDMVCRYEHEGQRYLHVVNFAKHQVINRPTKSKLPPCWFHDLGGDTEGPPRTPGGRKKASRTPHGELTEGSSAENEGPEAPSGTPETGSRNENADTDHESATADVSADQTPSMTAHTQLTESSVPEVEVEVEVEVEQGSGSGTTSITSATAAPPTDPAPAAREDVERICAHLADRIEANGSRRPAIGKRWRTSARLMLDTDKRTEDDVHAAINWCQANDFWRSNILSLPKLRDKYDQLRLQAERERTAPPRAAAARPDWNAAMDRARARDAAEAATTRQPPWKAIAS